MSKKKLKDLIQPIDKKLANNFENLISIRFEDLDTRYDETHFEAHFRINPNHKAILIKKEGIAFGILERDSFNDNSDIIPQKKSQKNFFRQSQDPNNGNIIPRPPTSHIPTFECQTQDCVEYKKSRKYPFYDRDSEPPICNMCLKSKKRII